MLLSYVAAFVGAILGFVWAGRGGRDTPGRLIGGAVLGALLAATLHDAAMAVTDFGPAVVLLTLSSVPAVAGLGLVVGALGLGARALGGRKRGR